MNKKTLGIILVVLIVVIAGMVYFGLKKDLFTGKGISIGGIGKKSIIDMAREQGQTVPSKAEASKECAKETDQSEKDLCYGILSFYYRDASFCKYIKDPEIKKNCNQTNIEKWYSEMGKGGTTSPFMPGGLIPGGGMLPTGGMIPSGETGGETGGETDIIPSDASSQLGPTVEPSGKMTDEIYIEILAQTTYSLQKYAQSDPKKFASYMKEVYEKYGIPVEEAGKIIEDWGKELEKDPQRAAELGQMMMKRAMELQGMGQ